MLKNALKPLGGFILWGCVCGVFSSTAMGMSVEEKLKMARSRCTPPQSSDPILYGNVFSGPNKGQFTNEKQIKKLYQEVYKSSARLINRVGYEADGRFVSRDLKNKTNYAVYNERIIKGIIKQVEAVLKHDHARYIFFPDMGHSHLFIPVDYYDSKMRDKTLTAKQAQTLAMGADKLKILYHVAEKLIMTKDNKVLDDMDMQWRFHTRNPTLDLDGNIQILKDYSLPGSNTVRKLEGYRYYPGFNISANEEGCFPFETPNGKLMYFDLSAWDLPYPHGTYY